MKARDTLSHGGLRPHDSVLAAPRGATSQPALALHALGLVHPNGQRALRGVQFALERGARLAIIGPSGAGKTTLLRVMGTGLRAGEGQIEVLGVRPWQLAPGALRTLRARIGLIHQAPPIPPRLRVITAVLAGRLGVWSGRRALASLLLPSDIEGARAALARFDLADRLFDRCDRLSGGQLQRVGMARVLYQAPQLLLADEPVSALDPALADAALSELVAQSHANGATLVASLHAVDLALKWFDRIIGMRAGEVLFDAPASAVSRSMLHALYATEGGVLPTQAPGRDNDPNLADQDSDASESAWTGPGRGDGDGDRGGDGRSGGRGDGRCA